MGLRDLFRSKNTTPTPQPSPGAAPSDPAAGPVSGQATPPEAVQSTAGDHHEHPRQEPTAEPLPQDGALQHLVELLLARGADRARLTLVQSGNIMTHQTRQGVGEAPDEVENGTVDQGSPLFDDVADLYTQAMSTPVGPWRQLDLVVSASHHAAHEITVTYDYPNGESRTEHYSHPGGGSVQQHHGASDESRTATPAHHEEQHQASSDDRTEATDRVQDHHGTPAGHGSDDRAGAPGHVDAAGAGTVAGGAAGLAAAGTSGDQGDHIADAHRSEQGHAPGEAAEQVHTGAPQDSDAVRVVSDGHTEPATDGDVLAAGQAAPVLASGEQSSAERAEDGSPAVPAEERSVDLERAFDAQDGGFADGAAGSEEDEHFDQGLGEDPRVLGGGPTHDGARGAQPGAEHASATDTQDARSSEDLPAHVDESAFGTESEDTLVPAPVRAAVDGDDDPAGAPQVATATDVSPSYRAPAPEQDVDPDALATGNLALTVGDVTARLADAQRHLFGPEGTAREVSTVLIRVRALGTYYDALTHVRLNGFWDQRPTFDLVPEDQLKVQELKDDSYVEGSGAPLAMMFRFRPGVPPEVAFDYSDEEAFVRYEQRLPGQNYLEELRMYPRTGSNIPQHVNDALQDWNY